MKVHVDHRRQHQEPARVDNLARAIEIGADCGDPTVGNRNVRVLAPVIGHNDAAPDDYVEHEMLRPIPSRNRRATARAAATSSSRTASSGWWLTPPGDR